MESCHFQGASAMAMTFRVISEQVSVLKRLSEEEGRYSVLVESLQYAIITVDSQGTVQSANGASFQVTGYPPSDLKKAGLDVLFPSSQEFFEFLTSKTEGPKEFQLLHKTKGSVFVEMGVGSFFYHSRPHFVVCLQDISERKREEMTTLKTARLAGLGEMAAGIGHEIKNPLAIIKANAERLSSLLKKDAERGLHGKGHRPSTQGPLIVLSRLAKASGMFPA